MPYASKYYDPTKAHEYYMRTRELKGYENRYGGSRGNGTSAASSGSSISGTLGSSRSSSSSGSSRTSRSSSGSSRTSKSSSGITDGNGKPLTETQAHNLHIRNEIDNLRKELSSMSSEDRKANREAYNDRIQKLREQTKGGSTSGFNQKGKEAAAHIKYQMEKERDEIITKSNKEADNQMLDRVKSLQSDIKAMRESGRGFSHKEFASRIKAMLGETKKIKTKTKRRLTSEYTQKYKDEIDKLRSDESMFTYYDKKRERLEKEAQKAASKASKASRGSSGSGGGKSGSGKSSGKKSKKEKKTNQNPVKKRGNVYKGVWTGRT